MARRNTDWRELLRVFERTAERESDFTESRMARFRAARATTRERPILAKRSSSSTAVQRESSHGGLNSAETWALYERGFAYYFSGLVVEALVDFEAVVRVEPEFVYAVHGRAMARHAIAKKVKFWRELKLKGSPSLAIANRFVQGAILRGVNEPDNLSLALDDYDRAIELKPSYAAAHANRAVLHADEGRVTSAERDFNKSIEIGPARPVMFLNRGIFYFYRGDIAAAWSDFEQALELDPGYFEVYLTRGRARMAVGDFDGAREDFREVARLDPDDDLIQIEISQADRRASNHGPVSDERVAESGAATVRSVYYGADPGEIYISMCA